MNSRQSLACQLILAYFSSTACLFANPEPATTAPELEARRAGWTFANIVVERMEQNNRDGFPGVTAWLKDYHSAFGSFDPEHAAGEWPVIDADALTTRNPNFWAAYYEIAPADPGIMLLHAGLLLYGGEGNRAQYLCVIALQRTGVPEPYEKAMMGLINYATRAAGPSNEMVKAGIALHDRADFRGALKKYDEALKLWPQNGWAHYERGQTLMTRKRGSSANSSEVAAEYAAARRHDPFQIYAYQGSDPVALHGMMALMKDGIPVWEEMARSADIARDDASILRLAGACQEAGIHDLALALRQIAIARRGRYDPADHPFITASLRALAPGTTTDATLDRLAGGEMTVMQLVQPASTLRSYSPSEPNTRPPGPFNLESAVFYQDTEITSQRLSGDAGPLGDYGKAIEARAAVFWASLPRGTPAHLQLVFMLKPGGAVRFWFASDGVLPEPERMETLRTELMGIPRPPVKGGPVTIGMTYSLWNAPALNSQVPGDELLFPSEWRRISMEKQLPLKIPLPDSVLVAIWPD